MKGFEVSTTIDPVAGFRIAVNDIPDLIIVNKHFPNLDGKGFLTKKRTSGKITIIPVFLIGEFSSDELQDYKSENVTAFISSPINPFALSERLYTFFRINPPAHTYTAPMILDMHARGKIIIAQIEGSLEVMKIELFLYLLRAFCRQKKIKSPRIFLIFPSILTESITHQNIERIFKFLEFPELEIEPHNIKILTTKKELVDYLKSNERYAKYEVVRSYFEGIRTLLIDFNKEKKIPVEFLKTGSCYIFDLFNSEGKLFLPALKKVSETLLNTLKENNITTLTYYSDDTISEAAADAAALAGSDSEELDTLENVEDLDNLPFFDEYEAIETEVNVVKCDDKHSLFFQQLKGKKVLAVTLEQEFFQVITDTLKPYFHIAAEKDWKKIETLIQQENYIIIFLDTRISSPPAHDMLRGIRKYLTRRKTSVIIMADKIDKESVIRFKESGTDNIIVSPFSTAKILQKIFDSVTQDRKS